MIGEAIGSKMMLRAALERRIYRAGSETLSFGKDPDLMSRPGVVLIFELVSYVNPEVVGGCCSPDVTRFELYLREDFDPSSIIVPRHLEIFPDVRVGGRAGNSRMPQLPAGICYHGFHESWSKSSWECHGRYPDYRIQYAFRSDFNYNTDKVIDMFAFPVIVIPGLLAEPLGSLVFLSAGD
ncbi:hypothetical protein F511_12916 [Dorcoceras hygrometricum]|uniref:Uncharacterized protein n=1 Tax=Dorcoceras hygrometricum TaxID=472368 RepID=A0A2Z7BRK1_9LAMI|nr:hypothetical protein F511_12916 [Dorcoceras hygrometricum]